jgi:VCBS repeat-containing protein
MNASVPKLSFLFFFFWGYVILKGQTYTFTNAGATGREGPTQAQVDDNYSGTSLEDAVTINTQGIQEWTVPMDGNYSIEARGAQGGGDSGGLGATMKGTFQLSENAVVKIVVGQKGLKAILSPGKSTTNVDYSASGGGGSYVVQSPFDTNSSIMVIAGGGGASPGISDFNSNGSDGGQISHSGADGYGQSAGGAGGDNGNGGSVTGSNVRGTGGGGFFSDGLFNNSSIVSGKSFLNGSQGGFYGEDHNGGADGGFGGGGACYVTGWRGSGGGGGYSGGGAGYVQSISSNSQGGGGGSFNSGIDQNNSAGANEGDGLVIITFLGSANQAPEITQGAGPLTKTIDEDNIVTWTTSELNATDPDTNASNLAWSLLTSPSNGSITVDGNGSSPTSLSYQPNANYHGSDSFSVQVSDGDANDSITINLTINPVDDPAVISGDTSGFLLEDSSLTGDLNATDIDGLTDGTYFTISSAPSSGSLSINQGSGQWTYYPNSNTYGDETFTVTVTDDQNFTATQVINLNVISVNDLTTLTGDFNGTSNEDTLIRGDINASDIDGLTDGSYFSISLNPSNGVATIDPVDGNWSYSPFANYFGSDAFTVTITDDQGYTATQNINLAVNPIDDPTVISGDTTASLIEDSPAYGDLNASDNDGLSDGTYFTLSSTPSNGSASIDPASGTWSYSPSANFYGNDSFTITVSDDLNNTATQIISLTVAPIDDTSLITGAISGKLYLDHNVSGTIYASDIDGLTDGSYFSISSNPVNGVSQINTSTGQWIYSPNAGFLGDDSFTIQITDDQGYTTTQSITIVPQYNVAVAKTGQPMILADGNSQLSASIIYDGGLPILEVGFYTSSSSQFTTSTKHPISLANGSSTFTLELNQTELTSTIFVRAYARNQNGETLGDIKRYAPPPIVMQWSSHATVLDNGWMQSDWFGTFNHYPQNWIFHSRLGWLYIPDSTTEELWLWSPDHGWLWTGKNVFPHLYKNSTGTWLYLLDQEVKGKNIYDYQSGLFE